MSLARAIDFFSADSRKQIQSHAATKLCHAVCAGAVKHESHARHVMAYTYYVHSGVVLIPLQCQSVRYARQPCITTFSCFVFHHNMPCRCGKLLT